MRNVTCSTHTCRAPATILHTTASLIRLVSEKPSDQCKPVIVAKDLNVEADVPTLVVMYGQLEVDEHAC